MPRGLAQAQSLQHPVGPSPIPPLCPAGPSPIPSPIACSALPQPCDSQQHLVALKTSPFHTPRPEIAQGLGSPRLPRVSQNPSHQRAAAFPRAGTHCSAWSQRGRPSSLLVSSSLAGLTLAPYLCFTAGNLGEGGVALTPPQEGRPGASPQLGGFAKRYPGCYLPELVSRSRRQMLRPPSSELVPSRARRGAGEVV